MNKREATEQRRRWTQQKPVELMSDKELAEALVEVRVALSTLESDRTRGLMFIAGGIVLVLVSIPVAARDGLVGLGVRAFGYGLIGYGFMMWRGAPIKIKDRLAVTQERLAKVWSACKANPGYASYLSDAEQDEQENFERLINARGLSYIVTKPWPPLRPLGIQEYMLRVDAANQSDQMRRERG